MSRVFRFTTIVFLLFVLSPILVIGQQACEAFVQQAFNVLGTNCANQDLNSICYGYNGVNAGFIPNSDVQFEVPSDRADLQPLETVRTLAFDEANNIWGIAVMRVQANLPESLPGQATVLMMLGDVTLENTISTDEAVIPDNTIPVAIAQTTDVLRFPPDFDPEEHSTEIGIAATGEEFNADGITEDGAYVRIYFEFQDVQQTSYRATAWVSSDSLEAFDEAELTVLTATSYTPMQVFTVTTGIGQPSCAEAPDQLFVQGPGNIETEIILNGVEMTIASTLVARSFTLNGEPGVLVFGVNGGVALEDKDDDTADLLEGQVMFIPYDEVGDGDLRGAVLTGWTPEQASGLGSLTLLPPNILNYPIVLPSVGRPSGIGQ